MKIASVAAVKARFSAYLTESEQGPVIVTRNGKPVAVLLAMSDEDKIERLLLAYSPKLRAILDAARQHVREGAGVHHTTFWDEMETDRLEVEEDGSAGEKPADNGS